MGQSRASLANLLSHSRRMANLLLRIGENRLSLWLVEFEEEREHMVGIMVLAVGTAIFSLLCGIAVSGCIVVLLWPYSPLLAFGTLVFLYGIAALVLFAKFTARQKEWKPMDSSISQLKKDRLWIEKMLT